MIKGCVGRTRYAVGWLTVCNNGLLPKSSGCWCQILPRLCSCFRSAARTARKSSTQVCCPVPSCYNVGIVGVLDRSTFVKASEFGHDVK